MALFLDIEKDVLILQKNTSHRCDGNHKDNSRLIYIQTVHEDYAIDENMDGLFLLLWNPNIKSVYGE
jgi:hypothetical protein